MGNANDKGERVTWEYQVEDGWVKYDKDTTLFIEAAWSAKNMKFAHKESNFDLEQLVERIAINQEMEKVRPLRRQLELAEAQLKEPDQTTPSSTSTHATHAASPATATAPAPPPAPAHHHHTHKSSEMGEVHKLKQDNVELMNALREAIQERDMALNTSESAQEALRLKNVEIDKLRELIQSMEPLKKELNQKKEEVKQLSALNAELRLKLTSELQELGMKLRPDVEETEGLKTRVHILTMEVQDKEREIDILKSAPVTPVTSPRPSTCSPPSPLIPKKDKISPKSNQSQKQHKRAHSSAGTPVSASGSASVSMVSLPLLPNSNSDSMSSPISRKRSSANLSLKSSRQIGSPGNVFSLHPQFSISMDQFPKRRSTEHGKMPSDENIKLMTTPMLPGIKSARGSGSGSRKEHSTKWAIEEGLADSSRDSKKHMLEVEELKERLTKTEGKIKSLEGELEVERLKLSNMKRELNGRDQEIELIRQQKMKLKDEFNEQLQTNEELHHKLVRKSEQLLKYEKKFRKFKTKDVEHPSATDSSSSEESTSALQEEINDLVEKLSDAKSTCRTLKADNAKLVEGARELIERVTQLEEQKMQLEGALAKVSSDLKEKDKEISQLKNAQKDVYSTRLFKVLGEEAQNERAKALTFSQKCKTLTEELKDKDREIESLRVSLKSQNFKRSLAGSPMDGDTREEIRLLNMQLKEQEAKNHSLQQEIIQLQVLLQEKTPQIVIGEGDEDELVSLKEELEIVKNSLAEKDSQIEELKRNGKQNGYHPAPTQHPLIHTNTHPHPHPPNSPGAEKTIKALSEQLQLSNSKFFMTSKELNELKARLDIKEKEILRLNGLLSTSLPQVEDGT